MTEDVHEPSQSDVDQFAREGAIVLRGVFADWVEPLRRGIDKLMDAPSANERSVRPKDGSAPFFQDLCNWSRIDEFCSFVFESPAAAMAARLMRSKTARFFHDHVLVKEPGTSLATFWHSDHHFYCVDGRQSVSFWIALDPVPRETALECIAGSHLWGVNYKPRRFDGKDLYDNDPSSQMPDIDNHRDDYAIVGWAVEPGDAVAFDFRTIHGAGANKSPLNRRRVFSARWVGDDAVFLDRQGKGSPSFAHLSLKTGDPLNVPDFPVVYGR